MIPRDLDSQNVERVTASPPNPRNPCSLTANSRISRVSLFALLITGHRAPPADTTGFYRPTHRKKHGIKTVVIYVIWHKIQRITMDHLILPFVQNIYQRRSMGFSLILFWNSSTTVIDQSSILSRQRTTAPTHVSMSSSVMTSWQMVATANFLSDRKSVV